MSKTVLIAGAGPAGLTAALELLRRSDLKPIVFEALDDVGGISRTINHRGNRMDIGGHRFFSKSDWVMDWWRAMLPVAPEVDEHGYSRVPAEDRHLLVRPRLSRIYFLRRFFDYPISLSAATIRNLGLARMAAIGLSYLRTRLFPRRQEQSLEDFFVNRFGQRLYRTFFKDYTEKVWGVPCTDISAEWGAQRIKGLSITGALKHALQKLLTARRAGSVEQKGVQTSLIERFLYPKFGPGQMWQTVAAEVVSRGGEIHHGHRVIRVDWSGRRVTAVHTLDAAGTPHRWTGDHVISTMPVRDLVNALQPSPPIEVRRIADGLCYRDFMTIGLLVRKLRPTKDGQGATHIVPDTWIYIQEPDVRIGRLQIFNNWSPAMVSTPDAVWLGLEYFCQEGDDLWSMDDEAFFRLAASELEKIDLIDASDVLDWHLVRVPKAYPAYFGTYAEFQGIRDFTDTLGNLYLVGRNGMHRYNNQDHSMLTARLAVDDILAGGGSRDAIWSINVDDEYHEEKR
jgi:protoporphyrinogen oxidase